MLGGGLVNDLRRDGCTRLAIMSSDKVIEINEFLLQKNVYNAHVQAKASKSLPLPQAFGQSDWPMYCHAMEDAVLAPHFFERAISTFDIAKDYFDGDFPFLYSMNVFWTQRNSVGPNYADTHWWHRDGDCKKQLVLFMYGRDILVPEQGAHLYQRGSHVSYERSIATHTEDALGYDFQKPPNEVIETFTGKAGTTFMVDTKGMHMGIRPDHRRLLLWARWGIDDPPVSYGWDRLAPVAKERLGFRYPTDPTLQRAVHLVAS